jgi:hypothetical protein
MALPPSREPLMSIGYEAGLALNRSGRFGEEKNRKGNE